MSLYYSPTGRPMDMMEWAESFDSHELGHRIIGQHYFPSQKHERVLVSTVYLGLDHSFFGGPPLIFETMVFASPTGMSDLYMERYSTIEQAVAGHWRWVRKARRQWPWWYLKAKVKHD